MTPDQIVRGKPLLTRVRTSNDIKCAEDLTSRWCDQGKSYFGKGNFEKFLLMEGLGFRYQRLHSPPKDTRPLYLSGALQGCPGCDESSSHPWSEYLEASELLKQRRFSKPPMVGFNFQHNDKRIYSYLEFANDLLEQGFCGSSAGISFVEQFNGKEERIVVAPVDISKTISDAQKFFADVRFGDLASSNPLIPNPHNLSLSFSSEPDLAPGFVSPPRRDTLDMNALHKVSPAPAPTPAPAPAPAHFAPPPPVALQPTPVQNTSPSSVSATGPPLQGPPSSHPLTSGKLLAAAQATIQGRSGSMSARMAAIVAVVDTLQEQEARLKAAILSETKVSYGTKQTWKPPLVTLHEERSEILECLNVELQKSIVTLNSEVELCSARMKSVDSDLVNKMDRKFRGSLDHVLDRVAESMAGQEAKIAALDRENSDLLTKLTVLDEQVKLLVDNSLYHGTSLETMGSGVLRIERLLSSSNILPVDMARLPASEGSSPVISDVKSRLGTKRQVESPWLSGVPPSKISTPQVVQRTVIMNPSPSPLPTSNGQDSIFPTPTSPSSVSGHNSGDRSHEGVSRQLTFSHPPPPSPVSGLSLPDYSHHPGTQGENQDPVLSRSVVFTRPGTQSHLQPLFPSRSRPLYPNGHQQLNSSAFLPPSQHSSPGQLASFVQGSAPQSSDYWGGQDPSRPYPLDQAHSQFHLQGQSHPQHLLQGQSPSQPPIQEQAPSHSHPQGHPPSQPNLQGLPSNTQQWAYQGQAPPLPSHPHNQGVVSMPLHYGQAPPQPLPQGQGPSHQGQTRSHQQSLKPSVNHVRGFRKGRK